MRGPHGEGEKCALHLRLHVSDFETELIFRILKVKEIRVKFSSVPVGLAVRLGTDYLSDWERTDCPTGNGFLLIRGTQWWMRMG